MGTLSSARSGGLHPALSTGQSSTVSGGSSLEQCQWYALHTRCRHEKQVAAQLQEKGIEVFLPLIKEVRRWSDRRKLVEVPLFSCYVFVCLALANKARTVAVQAPGVLRFVGFHDGPAAIPRSEIEGIQKVLAAPANCSPYEFLKVGQKVRIRGGSLDGIEGILIGRNGARRLVVSVNVIQQSMAVAVEGYDIEPVQ
jgi:transcriptional antiterminator NusG